MRLLIFLFMFQRLGENAGRKKRSLADLDNILTAAGASDDIKEQCKLFAPLCRAAVVSE